eukprot:CAMPEP_0197461792 /NCGR_PEP_ID=MMETSP1175-20131217/57417_1 /TAXON_ID=1003142 /ORGANISM="Triceratium dubium, Strain CCMP147" /LENGTH=46 /DNA_ID= /DNA_START= /DNA_END= /DNA_ORIENTATION=
MARPSTFNVTSIAFWTTSVPSNTQFEFHGSFVWTATLRPRLASNSR